MAIKVLNEKCVGCKLCLPTCAQGAITILENKKAFIDQAKCNYCGACLDACKKFKAILIQVDRKESNRIFLFIRASGFMRNSVTARLLPLFTNS
ncbi:MAG: 4Fe-4S dicluster domain-containing protein [Candidatus Firestonebacteria bacterium]